MDSYFPLLLAFVSSFLYGLSHIFARLSLEHLHPVVVAGIFTFVNLVIAGPIGFSSVPIEAYRLEGILSFAIMGVFGFAGLRILFALGVRLLGASRNAPIANIYPIFTALGGVILLGEETSFLLWTAIFLIVIGIWWMAFERGESSWNRTYLLIPLFQALFRTIGTVAQKFGLIYMNTPMFAIAIGGISGGICLVTYGFFSLSKADLQFKYKKELFYGVLLGLTNTAALYLFTVALSRSKLSVVVPIVATAPLFTIILAKVFLLRLEKIRHETFAGGSLVVIGTILVLLAN